MHHFQIILLHFTIMCVLEVTGVYCICIQEVLSHAVLPCISSQLMLGSSHQLMLGSCHQAMVWEYLHQGNWPRLQIKPCHPLFWENQLFHIYQHTSKYGF